MPTRLITVSTATGIHGPVDYGEAYRHFAYSAAPTSTGHTLVGTVQGAIGGGGWQTVFTLTTGNSTGYLSSTGSDLPLFDKVRLNLSANNSTGSVPVWLAASD